MSPASFSNLPAPPDGGKFTCWYIEIHWGSYEPELKSVQARQTKKRIIFDKYVNGQAYCRIGHEFRTPEAAIAAWEKYTKSRLRHAQDAIKGCRKDLAAAKRMRADLETS